MRCFGLDLRYLLRHVTPVVRWNRINLYQNEINKRFTFNIDSHLLCSVTLFACLYPFSSSPTHPFKATYWDDLAHTVRIRRPSDDQVHLVTERHHPSNPRLTINMATPHTPPASRFLHETHFPHTPGIQAPSKAPHNRVAEPLLSNRLPYGNAM